MTNAKRSTKTATTSSAPLAPDAALWRIIVNQHEVAEAAYDAHGGDYDAGSKGERESDRLADVAFEARERLFKSPAPDADALAYKLRELERYLREVESEDAERLAAVAADVRRLFGVA